MIKLLTSKLKPRMKYSFLTYWTTAFTGILTFIITYFTELALCNADQYMALVAVLILDGYFGVRAGIKREGFKTYKALKILKTIVTWILILTTVLSIEKAFPEVSWMSETLLIPFLTFELISILKNASMAGYIKQESINMFLNKIDQHKGKREE